MFTRGVAAAIAFMVASERCGAAGAGAMTSATAGFAAGLDSTLLADFVGSAFFAAGFAEDFASEGFASVTFAAAPFAGGTLGSRDGVRADLTLTASSFFDFVFEFALTTSADFFDLPD